MSASATDPAERGGPSVGVSSAGASRVDAVALDRATAALYGLAIGDALGMPTQLMSRRSIRDRFGVIDGFRAAAPDHPIAAGRPAGSITDDTEQAMLLAHEIVASAGHVDPSRFARRLIEWEEQMHARSSLDLLGPSTKAAIASVLAGTPVESSGRFGTTNGAAMRVTPVAIARRSDDLAALIDLVVEAGLVSHNTSVAIAGAAAVAAAVSAGTDGASPGECIEIGVQAAAIGCDRGHWVAGADVSRRIQWAVSLVRAEDPAGSLADIAELVGTSLATQESVPAAFGVFALYGNEPWAACCAAASLGGDTDTVAAMVGAMAGACSGMAGFPPAAISTVRSVNGLELEPLAARLLSLR